jgi:Nuclear pore protein NUP188 C-terminal domain
MATEAHSLALLFRIISTFRISHPSTPIPTLKLKRPQLAEGIEVFLSHRRVLAAKIIPMTPADVELAGLPGPPGAGSMLEARVVKEMSEARGLLLDDGEEENA